MSELRRATSEDVHAITSAVAKLRAARDLLVKAGAKRAAPRVRAAIKSAEGALRHAWRAYDATYAAVAARESRHVKPGDLGYAQMKAMADNEARREEDRKFERSARQAETRPNVPAGNIEENSR